MKVGILFPGYGSQFVGMAKELYDEFRIIQELFEEASVCLPTNFVKLCFASSDAELGKAANAYPAIFLVSVSILELLKQEGIQADVVAGHLGGEYAALYAGGGLSFPDGLYLLNKFSSLYQELLAQTEFALLRVSSVQGKKLAALCNEISDDNANAAIAVYESLQDFVVSGHASSIEQMRYKARELGAVVKNAPLEIGLHSPLMVSVATQLKMYLEKVDFNDMRIPFISSQDGKQLFTSNALRSFVIDSIVNPVRWDKVVKSLDGCDVLIEVGPGKTLTDMFIHQYPTKKIISINKAADIQQLKDILAQQAVKTE